MQRLVLDTAVVASAFRSRHGASNLLLQAVAHRQAVACVMTALFLEYEDVLNRPEQRAASGLDAAATARALAALAAVLEPVDVHFRWRPQLRDPADEMVLEAAINGRADAIVTFNRRDFAGRVERFGIGLLPPAGALAGIKA
jgi:putative PIN family toxin of toxin-antitoxin system